jgi:hypothetical protein
MTLVPSLELIGLFFLELQMTIHISQFQFYVWAAEWPQFYFWDNILEQRFPTFFHGGTPKIHFHIPRNPDRPQTIDSGERKSITARLR